VKIAQWSKGEEDHLRFFRRDIAASTISRSRGFTGLQKKAAQVEPGLEKGVPVKDEDLWICDACRSPGYPILCTTTKQEGFSSGRIVGYP
jgi:hypothetical protein